MSAKKKTKGSKKTFMAVRSELIKALDKAREKFGTDTGVSKNLGFADNYIASIRNSAKNNDVKYDKMLEVAKEAIALLKAVPGAGALKKAVKKAAKTKTVKKKVAKKTIKKKLVAKKYVKSSKKKVTSGNTRSSNTTSTTDMSVQKPLMVGGPAPEKVEVCIGDVTFNMNVAAGDTIDVTIYRGVRKILARI